MKEALDSPKSPRERVLGTVDGIVAGNPKLSGMLPEGSAFTFSVGYCARAGQAQTPRQVVVANKPAYGNLERTTTIVVQAASREEDFRFLHVDPAQAADVLTGEALNDDQLTELQHLLADTEFGNPELVQAFGDQYAQFMQAADSEARWWQGMLQMPVADLRV